jgi:3-methyladenine DNA glycosylase/8-oxoguanine DNA glycosylase
VDLYRTLRPLRRGTGDPTFRVDPAGAVWRAVRTPDGPGTLRLSAQPALGEITAAAWGPGADWLLEQLPALCGAEDDPSGFAPAHPLLRAAVRRHPGFRLTRAGQLIEVLVPCVLEQKTTGKQARASFRELVHRYGAPAPGPVDGLRLMVQPSAADWALVPSWAWHRAGVEPARSRTIVTAVRHAGRLEETVRLGSAVADQRLRALPGIGVWTSAEIRQRVHGDPDAVSVGDYHLPATVGYSLTGERVDDAGMLELLAPYAGHRYRACALIELVGSPAPRRGPRLTIQDHRGH